MKTATIVKLTCLLGAVGLALLVLVIPHLRSARWVGRGELTIEWIVNDSQSDQPIPNAQIEVFLLDRPPTPEGQRLFVVSTDSHGIARRTERVMTAGGDTGFPFFSETDSADVPAWRCRVSAVGFDGSEIANLQEHRHETEQSTPAKYKLTLPIHLNRKATP
jgi:hypothetical protein